MDTTEIFKRANLVICATTERVPLFESVLLRNDAVVIAVGCRAPDARELDGRLLGRSELRRGLHERASRNGNVVMAVDDGYLGADSRLGLADVLRTDVGPRSDQPVVFMSSGMSWQDLVIAQVIVARALR